MTVIICVDDTMGMTFNKRRQSQDRLLRERILETIGAGILRMSPYSARQFKEYDLSSLSNVAVSEDFLSEAGDEDYCFVENLSLLPYDTKIDRVILYRWNKRYPADTRLDLSIHDESWNLVSTEDFPGYSHETITEEVYER